MAKPKLTPIDEQLAEVRRRRENATDLLVRALIEIDTCTDRIDVLLDRRRNQESPAERTQEMPAIDGGIDPTDQMT